MQRLITIFLSNERGYINIIEEFLEKDLKDGWKVKMLTPIGNVGGGGSSSYAAGWMAIVLEK